MKRLYPLAFSVMVLILPNASAFSQTKEVPLSGGQEQLSLDRQRFEFEKSKYLSDTRLELYKAVATCLALVVPLLVAIYTVRAQVKSSERLKAEEAKQLFLLKAAEIVMNVSSPWGVRNKARLLQVLFPDRLPEGFAQSFEPEKFTFPGPSAEIKRELFRHILEHPDREREIVELWFRMFPGDKLEHLFPAGQSRLGQDPKQPAPNTGGRVDS